MPVLGNIFLWWSLPGGAELPEPAPLLLLSPLLLTVQWSVDKYKFPCNIIVLMEGYEDCIPFIGFQSFQLRRTLRLIFKKKDDYTKLHFKKNAQTSLNRSLDMP